MAIELTVEYKRLNAFFADYTKNISKGGTFIKTDKPLPIGTEFTFKLAVPTLEMPLELRGRVQWVVQKDQAEDGEDPGMGIGFVYETEVDRARIATLVEQLMVGSLGPHLYDKLMQKREPD
jgi:type IV pilus assembly protein PilZ